MVEGGVFLGLVNVAAVDEEGAGVSLMSLDEDASTVEIDQRIVHFDGG